MSSFKILAVCGDHRCGKSVLAKEIGKIEGFKYYSLASPVRSLLFKLTLDDTVFNTSEKNKHISITKKRPRSIPNSIWNKIVENLPVDEGGLTIGFMLKFLTDILTPQYFHEIIYNELKEENFQGILVVDDFRYIESLKFFKRRKIEVAVLVNAYCTEYDYPVLLPKLGVLMRWEAKKEENTYNFVSDKFFISINNTEVRKLAEFFRF
jgi:hypothetical protein